MKMSIFSLLIILLNGGVLFVQDLNNPGELSFPAHRFRDLDANSNIIYTPAFRAAWTSLVNDILGEPVILRTGTPLAEELNHYLYDASEDAGWITGAGLIEDGIMKDIDREIRKKYNTPAPGLDDIRNEKEGILCYSYLNINAVFKEAFEELNWNFNPGGQDTKVKCFGVSAGESEEKAPIRKQVSIYDYRNPDDFIIKITPADTLLEVIITGMNPEGNIYETIMETDRRINESFPDPLGESDELIIPVVTIDHSHVYRDLLGKYLLNKGFEEYFIAAAAQGINLRLDHTGASAVASGKVLLRKGPVPRIYAIDDPFILLIREKGKEEPLIFVRVSNTDFLVPVDNN